MVLPRLVCYFKKRLPANNLCKKMMLFFFLLSFLAGVWASHSQAPAGGGSVALLDNYHRMENLGIPLDENTKRALRLAVELGCREYAHHHSFERYETEAVASRVNLGSLESALQMFFPGCKVANLNGTLQEYSSITSTTPPYVVTTARKHGMGFYTNIASPRIWIRFDPSQPKASAHLREFLARNSKHFDILHLQDIHRDALAELLSTPDLVERVISNDISTSQTVFDTPLRISLKVLSRLLLQSFTKRQFTRDCRAISPSSSFASMSFRRTSAMLQRLQSLQSISERFH